jgi:hypothetical protein
LGVERAGAEAIYDSGREPCVAFIVGLAASVERLSAAGELLEDRVRRLETEARRDSRTGSTPPSQDPPKTRQQRRAEARAKAKELLAEQGTKRKAGGQEGDPGAGRRLAPEDRVDEIVAHYPQACGGCGRELSEDARRPGGPQREDDRGDRRDGERRHDHTSERRRGVGAQEQRRRTRADVGPAGHGSGARR